MFWLLLLYLFGFAVTFVVATRYIFDVERDVAPAFFLGLIVAAIWPLPALGLFYRCVILRGL